MSDIIVNLDINNTGFNVKIRNAEHLLSQFGRELRTTGTLAQSTSKGFGSLTSSLRDMSVIGYGIVGAFQAMNAAIFSWQHSIIEASAEIEKLTVLLSGLSDAQTQFSKNYDAHQNLKEMIALAKEAPFAMNEMMKSFVKFQSVKLDDPKRMVQALADAIAAFGGGNDEFHRASVAITQMAGKGVISMEELRQQLGEAVPSAISVMAKKLGMTYGELVEVVSSGSLEARKGLTALTEGFEEEFGGTAKRMMETWSGMTSQLQTNWLVFRDAIGQGGLFDAAKDFLKDVNSALMDPAVLSWADHFGERLGVMVGRLNEMFNWLVSNRETVEKLIDVSTALFAVWLGSKGISAVVTGLAGMFGIATKLAAPLKALSLVVAGATAAWVYFTEGVDSAGKKIGILDRMSRDVKDAMQSDLMLKWRVLWDDVTESVGGLWDKLYEGSSKYLPIVDQAIKNNTSVLEEFKKRVSEASDGTSMNSEVYETAWERVWSKETQGFAEVFSILFDAMIVEVGVQLSALFVDDLPRWIDQGLRRFPEGIKAALSDIKSGAISLALWANDEFYGQTVEHDGIEAALLAEQSAVRLASAMASIEMAVSTTEKRIEDIISNTNESIAKAMELRSELIQRVQETGNNLSPNDFDTQRQFFGWVDTLWSQYDELLARLEQAENDKTDIIRRATQEQMDAYESRRVSLTGKIKEIVDEIDSINLDIEDQSGIATPEQTSRIEQLNALLDEANKQMVRTEEAQRALSEASEGSIRLAPEQQLQYDALNRIIQSLRGAIETAGDALGEFNDKSKDGVEAIKILTPELRSARSAYESFAGMADKILRDAIPGGKELEKIKALDYVFAELSRSFSTHMKEGGEGSDWIDRQVEKYYKARAVLEGDYAKALERAEEKQDKLRVSAESLISTISSMRDHFESLAGYNGLSDMMDGVKASMDEINGAGGQEDLGAVDFSAVDALYEKAEKASDAMQGLAESQKQSWSDTAMQVAQAWGTSEKSIQSLYNKILTVGPSVQEASKTFGVPEAVILSIIRTESAFNSLAVSNKGASGLMQIMSETAGDLALGLEKMKVASYTSGQIMKDQHANIMAGTLYIKQLTDRYGSLTKALWAYNAGMGKLEKGIKPTETVNYIDKVMKSLEKLKNAGVDIDKTFSGSVSLAISSLSGDVSQMDVALAPVVDKVTAFTEVMSRYAEMDSMEGLQSSVQSYYESLFNLSPLMLEVMDYQQKMASSQNLTNEEIVAGEKALDDLEKAQKLSNERARESITAQEEKIASGRLERRLIGLTEAALNDLSDSYGTVHAATRKYNTEVVNITELVEKEVMTVHEATEAMKELRLEMMEAQGPFQAWIADLERAIPSFGQFTVNIMDSFVDTLVDGLAEGRLEFDSFVDDVKQMLARIAVNTIVLNILGNLGLTGLTGSTVSSAVGVTSGATGSLSGLSSVLSLGSSWDKIKSGLSWLSGGNTATTYGTTVGSQQTSMLAAQDAGFGVSGGINWANLGGGLVGGVAGSLLSDSLFEGDYVSIGSTIGGAAGTAMGSTLATVFSVAGPVGTAIGALVGSVAGGFLGSLFGDDEPKFGGYASSFSGKGFEDDASAEGAFGLNFGVSDKGSKNIEGSDYQDTLDGLAEVSNVLSDFYGTELETLTRNYLNTTYGDFTNWGKDLDSAFQNMFSTIISAADAVDPSVDGLGNALAATIESMGGLTGSASEMATQIETGIVAVTAAQQVYGTDLGEVLGMFDGGEFGSLSAASAQWVQYINMFRDTAETSSDTLTRLISQASTFGTAMELSGQKLENFAGSGKDFLYFSDQFATRLSEAGVSLDTLSTQQSSYFDAYYSEEEQLYLTRQESLSSITQFNEQMGLTGASAILSKESLRAYIESLDLTTEAGMDAYITAMGVSEAMDTFETSLEELEDAFDDAFLTDFERSLKKGEKGLDGVESELKKLNIELPDTREEFVDLALALKESDSAAYEYLLTLTDGIDAYYTGVEAQTSALDSIWEALDATSYTEAQMSAFEAGLESVGLSADITKEELLRLVQSASLTDEQISFLYGSLDMLSEKFGEVSNSATGASSSGGGGGGSSGSTQKSSNYKRFSLFDDGPMSAVMSNVGRYILGPKMGLEPGDDYYWYEKFLPQIRKATPLSEALKLADAPQDIKKYGTLGMSYDKRYRTLSYEGADNPFDRAVGNTNSQVVFMRRMTEMKSWNEDRTEEMLNHLVNIVGQTRDQAERAIQRAISESEDQLNLRYFVDSINHLKSKGDKKSLDQANKLLAYVQKANLDVWEKLFDEHVPRVLTFNEKMLRELEMNPETIKSWRDIKDVLTDLGVKVPKTAGELSKLRSVLDPEDFELLAVYVDDFDAIFDALEPFQEWLSTPTTAEAASSMDRMKALFDSWSITLPETKSALRELVNSGRLTDEQVLILAANLDDLQSAFDETSSSVDELKDRLQALIDAIDPDSELEKIKKASSFLSGYNLSLDRDQIGDYLRSLTESLNGGVIDAFEGMVDVIVDALDYIDELIEEQQNAVESLRGESDLDKSILDGKNSLNSFLKKIGATELSNLGNLDRDWLADYIEGLNPKTLVGAEILDFWMSVQESVLGGLDSINQISDTILGLYDNLDVKLSNESALTVLSNTLTEWGVDVPETTAAMRELILSGSLTQEQLLLLAEYSSIVTSAYGKQSEALSEQINTLNEAVNTMKALSNSLATVIKQVKNDIKTVSDVTADLDALRADALGQLSSADIDLMDEAIEKASEYRSELMLAYNEQLNALESQKKTLETTQESILKWVSDMRTALSPQQSVSILRSRYQSVLTQSQAGDVDALGDLTSVAGDYIEALKSAAGGSVEFAREYGRILAQIETVGSAEVNEEIDRVVGEIEALKSSTIGKLQELSDALSVVDQSIRSQMTTNEESIKTLRAQLDGLSEQQIESMSELTLMDMRARATEAERIIQAIAGINVQSNSLSVPGFATGGSFGGGLRLVGERGPELEFTGPSRIVSNNDITKHLSSANYELVKEVQSLRAEVRNLRLEQQRQSHAQMGYQRDTRDILQRWEVTGQPAVREEEVV